MLEGIYQTGARNQFSHTFIALFLSAISTFLVMIGLSDLFHSSRLVFIIGMLIAFPSFHSIFFMILNGLRIKRKKKTFFKKENLLINGATLVQIEDNDRFLYIEDDFFDEEGKPILLEYPSRLSHISQKDVGKRFLIIYDDDCNFQLVKLNGKLKGMVPDYSSCYPLSDNLNKYSRLPHPNMRNLEKDGHELSGCEKENFADLYVTVTQSIILKSLKYATMVIISLLAILALLLNFTEDGIPLRETLPIGVPAIIGFILILWICKVTGKGTLRRQAMKFIHVKKVIFHSYNIFEGTGVTVKVYEWYNGQTRLRGYPAGNQVAPNTVYGSVLYKFTNQNGNCVLLNTSPVGKKGK